MVDVQPGIHLANKQIGQTSFSLVQQFLRETRLSRPQAPWKVCHGGTLDPFAEGLVLLLVGPATRLFSFLHDIPKTYEFTIRWGIETDNGDPTGKAIATGSAEHLTEPAIVSGARSFIGWHDQVPHVTSARRVDGERAYDRARRGEVFQMPPAPVYLHDIEWVSHRLPVESRGRMIVRGGFYVRAFARDLGRQLHCGAHLATLRRTAIGPWQVPVDDQTCVYRAREICPWMPSRELSDSEVGLLRAGESIDPGTIRPGEWRLPENFPATRAVVRAMHQERLLWLLEKRDEALCAVSSLGRGL